MDYGNIAQLMLNGKEDTKVNDTGVEVKNNIKILYHGSSDRDIIPDINKCKRNNDYGPGFYTTEILDLAKEWAAYRGSYGKCYVNKYELDVSNLKIYEFDDSDFLQWLAVLLSNRQVEEIKNSKSAELNALIDVLMSHKYIDLGDYDCAIGWRADDAYYEYATSYVTGEITTETFINSIRKGNLGKQFVLLSKKAFDTIKLVGTEPVNYSIWDMKSKERTSRATRAVRFSIESPSGDLFAKRFVDEIRDLVKKG